MADRLSEVSSRVLIVDDEPGMRFLIRTVLDDLGADLCEADSVTEGRARALAEEWSVIVLDNRMPDGTGLELAAELRATGTTPIIIYSGYLDADARAVADALELTAIDKSRPEELHDRVRALLEPRS